MADVAYLLTVVLAFALLAGLVRACDRIAGRSAPAPAPTDEQRAP